MTTYDPRCLSRELLTAERRANSRDGDHLLSRHGHVFGNRRYVIRGFDSTITTFIYRAIVREHLLRAIPDDCDQIVEIGGGNGDNLFHLWLGGGPPDAEYLSLEISADARATSLARAAMERRVNFRAEHFDASTMQGFSDLIGGRRRSFVFTCSTLTLLPSLRDDFFDRIFAAPSIVGGIHFEQGGWQVDPSDRLSRAYDQRRGRNENWLAVLAASHRAKRLCVEDFSLNAFAAHALTPFSIACWSRHPPRSACRVGSSIDFSVCGNASVRRGGWSDPEDWGCWIDGPEASIYLALDSEPSRDLRLGIRARAFGRDSIATKVVANGHEIGTWRIAGSERYYYMTLPQSVWRPFDSAEITMSVDKCQAPHDLGISSDERLLSIGVGAITLEYC